MGEEDAAGGSLSLAAELDRYAAEIESDLLKVWGIDLLDLFLEEGSLSPARVLRLLSTLGDDSSYLAARRGGPQFQGWNYERYAATAQLDLLQLILFVLLRANGANKAKQPEPLPTPDDEQKAQNKGKNMFAAMATAAMDGTPITKWG